MPLFPAADESHRYFRSFVYLDNRVTSLRATDPRAKLRCLLFLMDVFTRFFLSLPFVNLFMSNWVLLNEHIGGSPPVNAQTVHQKHELFLASIPGVTG